MRICRDVRFSKDKSAYRTSIGIHVSHDGAAEEDEHLPGFFLHLAPGDSWIYTGRWRPSPPRLERIRKALVARSADWARVRAKVPPIEGETLQRPPPGFDPAHRFIADLKRKGFTAGVSVPDATVVRPDFTEQFLSTGRRLDPLNRFLTAAVGAMS